MTIVRPFNTFGPRQSARAVIPTIITQLLQGQKNIKLGSLAPTRDLLYVKDTVAGFIAIAKSEKTCGEEINIASGAEISMGKLAKKLISLIAPSAKIVQDRERLRPVKSEVERLLGANAKIKKLTGWKPQFNLDRGLAETIEWFRLPENLSRYKAGIYNL